MRLHMHIHLSIIFMDDIDSSYWFKGRSECFEPDQRDKTGLSVEHPRSKTN